MHIGRIILYSVLLDVLFYIAYSARYSLFVLMCRKTHITHSLTYRPSYHRISVATGPVEK